MQEHSTTELLARLTDRSADLGEILSTASFTAANLSSYLESLLSERRLRKSEVIRTSGLNATFAYQIFSGDRNPSRDKLLQLLFALRCNLAQTNRALRFAGINDLYCRNRRDAIIIFCLAHDYNLNRTDITLYDLNERTISDGYENATDRHTASTGTDESGK